MCSGVLLSKNLVLSSANCVITAQSAYASVSNLQVVAGAHDLDYKRNQIEGVARIITPFQYHTNDKNKFGADLIILVLRNGFLLHPCRLQAIKLPPPSYDPISKEKQD